MIRTDETSNDTFDALFAFGKAMKKEPVSCKVGLFDMLFVCLL